MKLSTARYALTGCAARIAANRDEAPVSPVAALAKLFIQPKRDWKAAGAPRIGWKRGEVFEVAEAVVARDLALAAEELGDCAYYLAQSWLWPALFLFPRNILRGAVRKMTFRAFKTGGRFEPENLLYD